MVDWPKILAASEGRKDHFYIERAMCVGLELQIEGWYFNEDSPTIEAEITVDSPRRPQSFAVQVGRERMDVADDRKNVHALRSGFRLVCRLDPRAGAPRTAEIVFWTEGSRPPARYNVALRHQPYRKWRVARHVAFRLSRRRLKTGVDDILHGRLDSLWMRMNHVFQHRHRHKAVSGSRLTDLGDALKLMAPAPLPCPALAGPVDIIIPAYNCLQYLDPLFESLERNTAEIHRVILVDNGNQDRAMIERLRLFAARRPNVELIRLEENQGFVGAVNRAAEIAERDFVLLNTDVIVPPLWLERMMAPLAADAKIASVTPFSNAATVCSFPEFCVDNPIYGGIDVDRIDQWFQHVRLGEIDVRLPSGVGFCMAVRRSLWLEIGPFDEVAFRRGYGEENDWCLRAEARGYKNVIAPDLFAYHKHGGTFESATRAELRQNSLNEVARRYPRYLADVDAYCNRDPLRPLREILSIVIACREADRPAHFFVDHQLGGGANDYRRDQINELVALGHPVLTFLIGGRSAVEMEDRLFLMEFAFGASRFRMQISRLDDLRTLFELTKVEQIVVNSIVSSERPLQVLALLAELKERTGARLIVPVHDFYPLCPSYTLLSNESRYCALPSRAACEACLSENHFAANPGKSTIGAWREGWGRFLRLSEEILCFSEDSRTHVCAVYPDVASKIRVRPHKLKVKFDRLPAFGKGGDLHIGVVGAIGPQKGSEIVRALASDMSERDPSAALTVIGEIDRPVALKNFNVTGRYTPDELPSLIESAQITVCLFPSIWPETFSYVCEELMSLEAPLAVFDLGAPVERVRHYRYGRVLDLALAQDAARLHDELRQFAHDLAGSTADA